MDKNSTQGNPSKRRLSPDPADTIEKRHRGYDDRYSTRDNSSDDTESIEYIYDTNGERFYASSTEDSGDESVTSDSSEWSEHSSQEYLEATKKDRETLERERREFYSHNWAFWAMENTPYD
ncbi:hypothetical protein IWQ62_005909, partial [Dispira parvispora]